MKSYNNLWVKFTSFKNLYLAYKNARKSKPNKKQTIKFSLNLEKELFLIQEQLLNKQYVFSKYFTFKIYEPKERIISAPCFRDVVVQHAIINVIEPIFDKSFINNSFACRKNKGVYKGLLSIKDIVQKSNFPKYYLKQDVRKYFPSIDKDILKETISKKIKDKELLDLIYQIIDSYCSKKGESKGIPIGNLTSQLFANIYLNKLDQYVTHNLKIKHYCRYVDDFLIFSDCSKTLKKIRYKTKKFLNINLLLDVPKCKQYINLTNKGVDFVGYKTFPTKIRLRKTNTQKFMKKTKHNMHLYKHKKLSKTKLHTSMCSYIAYAKKANSFKLLSKFFTSVGFSCLFINYY